VDPQVDPNPAPHLARIVTWNPSPVIVMSQVSRRVAEAGTMRVRAGISLIEFVIVCAILGVLLALLLPRVQAVRALEAACKNNLHQMNLAAAQFADTNKRLPPPGSSGLVGGWTVELLPYLDQKNLRDRIVPGTPIPKAPEFLLRQPRLLQCPVRGAGDAPGGTTMDHCHHVFVPTNRRDSFILIDAPLDLKAPWASGPEMAFGEVTRRAGPHRGGVFCARGFQQGVEYVGGGPNPE
jgi:hypothetical protein